MKHSRRIITCTIGTTFLGAALALWAWPVSTPGASQAPQGAIVGVAQVEAGASSRTVHVAGVTRAAREATLSFALQARLASRPVEIGDHVRPGQVLATLDARQYRHAVDTSRALLAELDVRLDQAEHDLARVQRLNHADAATAEELERATSSAGATRAARDAAAARLGDAERLLDEATLRAPFAGTVTAVHLEPGEWASPGQPLCELSGDGEVEVEVEVPESTLTRIAGGEPVVVVLPFAAVTRVDGRISSVARAAVGPGRLFPVVVELASHPHLTAGMTAELELELRSEAELTVPLRAVLNPGSSQPTVFRVDDGVARQVLVRPGTVVGDRVAVAGELAAGDTVVVAGHTLLADGDAVEVLS